MGRKPGHTKWFLEQLAKSPGTADEADPLQRDLAHGLGIARNMWRRMSFQEVAERVAKLEGKTNVAPTSIFQLEVARSWPKARRLRSMSRVLDVPAWRLMDREYMRLPEEARRVLDTVREAVIAQYADQTAANWTGLVEKVRDAARTRGKKESDDE